MDGEKGRLWYVYPDRDGSRLTLTLVAAVDNGRLGSRCPCGTLFVVGDVSGIDWGMWKWKRPVSIN